MTAVAEQGGSLNTFTNIFEKMRLNTSEHFDLIIMFVKIKIGKREGIIMFSHIARPSLAPSLACVEKIVSNSIIPNINAVASKLFFT
jgi:hypothetical protein